MNMSQRLRQVISAESFFAFRWFYLCSEFKVIKCKTVNWRKDEGKTKKICQYSLDWYQVF
jgi:hypothetical protein